MATPACQRMDRDNYTDVVIVGNGPSAISLSYFLHGHRPYYNGHAHSNSMLTEKLQDSKASIVDQDLEFLSEGLEGRSTNPVALLWDSWFTLTLTSGQSTPLCCPGSTSQNIPNLTWSWAR